MDTAAMTVTDRVAHELVAGEWISKGACTSPDAPDLETVTDEQFKALCAGCEVTIECLTYSFLIDSRHYVYGGSTWAERRHLDHKIRYSTCSAPGCGRGYTWERSGSAQPPGVCPSCNTTTRLAAAYQYHGDQP